MRRIKKIIAFIGLNSPILYRRFKGYLIDWYRSTRLDVFALFFLHRYSPHSFDVVYLKHNTHTLFKLQPGDWLTATQDGKIERLETREERMGYAILNFFLLGALHVRIQRVLYLTLMTLTLEARNPFNRSLLQQYLERRIKLVERLAKKVEWVNGIYFDQRNVKVNIEIFLRNSLIQNEMIREMQAAVKNQKEPQIIQAGKEGIEHGLFPAAIEQGRSGSYWIRNKNREVLGIFKPFDEEAYAPHNPIGPSQQGALGARRMRRGTRVGEAAHNEVAAFVLDSYFGFGIVPKTYYATFTHHVFYNASQNFRFTFGKSKTKIGSFQEFIEDFIPIHFLDRDEWPLIPLDEYQTLLLFDLISGNTDRHFSNLLVGDQKIAAIDHGYCFPDTASHLSTDVWSCLEQGKMPFHPAIKKLVHTFPFEEVSWKLRKRCFRSLNTMHRMRERLALFRAALDAELNPRQIAPLLTRANLLKLQDLGTTIDEKARELVDEYLPDMEEKMKSPLLERWLAGMD